MSPVQTAPPPSVTVALVPDARYDRLRALAARWVDAWLIDPLLLVRTGALAMSVAPGGGVPVVAGELLGRGIARPVSDVVAHLADLDAPPELVRVVDVVVGAAEGELPAESWTALRQEAEAVADVLRRAAGRRTVRRIALIAIDTGRSAVAGRLPDVPQPRWDVNVLAVAENRGSPGGFDAFVRRDESEYDGFVLAHLATVAGLWAGVRSGSYDRDTRGDAGHLDVQRVTVRAVQHGDRRVHTARVVAGLLLGDPGPTARGLGRVRAADGAELGVLEVERRERVLDEYAGRILDGVPERPLRVRVDDAVRALRSEKRGFIAAVRDLVRDTVGLVRAVAALPARRRDAESAPAGPVGFDEDTAADGGARRRLAEVEAALARSFRLDPPGIRIFIPGVALWGAGARRHAAGVWRAVHGPAVALLDGGTAPGAWDPVAWMRGQSFEGILPGPGSIVPDHLEGWVMPPVVRRLLEVPEASPPVRVGAADRIAIQYRSATLQRLVEPARAVVAAVGDEDGEAPGDRGGDPFPPPDPDPDVADPARDVDAGSGQGSSARAMTLAEARAVLEADATLTAMLERLDATGLGRVQRATADEFSRLCGALDAVRDRLDEALAGRSPRSWWDAIVRGAAMPLVTAPIAAALPTLVGSALVLTAVAVGAAYALRTVRTGRRLDAVTRARLLVDLSGIADRILDEWRRNEHMTSDLDDIVVLMSHLLHHGASPTVGDAPAVALLGRDDVPRLVRLALPVVRDDIDEEAGVDRRQAGRCLERQLVAGWRAELHGWLLEDVAAGAPSLFGGRTVHEAIDAEPSRAAELLERLADADGAHERAVFQRLVRRGVGVLEGLDVAAGDESERSATGTTGSPAARVRVLGDAVASLDLRTDGLAPSLPEHPVWDRFLLDGALPGRSDLSDPWAGHTFVLTQEAERAHRAQRTEVHAPTRLVATAERRWATAARARDPDVMAPEGEGGDARTVTWVPLVEDEAALVEVVVRVDTQPQPVHMSVLRAFATDAGAT